MRAQWSSGVYCIQSPNPARLALQWCSDWLTGGQLQGYQSVLWISQLDEHTLYSEFKPKLAVRQPHHRGFDLITLPSPPGPSFKGGVQRLCALLDSALVFSPALVIVDRLEDWFDPLASQVGHPTDPLYQSRYLRKWARLGNHTVMALLGDELPLWAGFCDGLAHWAALDRAESTVWWKEDLQFTSTLWHDQPAAEPPLVYRVEGEDALGRVARAVYHQRLIKGLSGPISVECTSRSAFSRGPVLIRLGADDVVLLQDAQPNTHRPEATAAQDLEEHRHDFAETLHDVFTPGQLGFATTVEFNLLARMLLSLSADWQIDCTLTRLTLLPHINARDSARCVQLDQVRGMVLVHNDALYYFKCWQGLPEESSLQAWVSQAFATELSAHVGGVVHFSESKAITSLLDTLGDQMAVFTQTDWAAMDSAAPEQQANATATPTDERPWLARLPQLMNLGGRP